MVCIGAGLLSTLSPGIADAKWIGYQIFGGIGYSLASNLESCTLDPCQECLLTLNVGSPRDAGLLAPRPCTTRRNHAPDDYIDELRDLPRSRSSII